MASQDRVLIEVCVDNVEGLVAAVEGGADRIELCSALAVGGLTPSPGLMAVAAECGLPIRAMIRPRTGDFHYTRNEQRLMRHDIDAARAAGLGGIVIGASAADHELDEDLLADLVLHAGDMEIALHRAIDLTADPVASSEIARALGMHTILTSGGALSAAEGVTVIRAMHAAVGDEIEILAGSGVTARSAAGILRNSGVRALHASCSVTHTGVEPRLAHFGFVSERDRMTSPEAVKALRAAAESAI